MTSNKRVYSSPLATEEKKLKMLQEISLICTEVRTKNGVTLLSSAFNVLDALAMWETVFNQARDLIFGVALIKTKDRGVGVNFKLKSNISMDLDKYGTFNFSIGSDSYAGRIFTERGPPPSLGEKITIKASGFGFNISLEEIIEWLALFGSVEGQGVFQDHSLAPVKDDIVTLSMRLRKHIPSILPAYGRKLQVYYHGQPKVCGACFDVGHVRKDCKNPRVEWMSYVKVFTSYVPLSMLGKWGDILKRNDPAYETNGMTTPAKPV